MNAANEELRKEITELKRSGKRQAAPFAKGTRRTNPKRPGRKPGMGLFSYRRPPSPDEITEPPVDVPVTADTCPGCGGRLQHEGVGLAYLTDIRPIPQPTVTKYRIQVCRCTVCGKQVRAHHPDVAPGPVGGQSPPGGETSHGDGPRASLWSGRSGAQSPWSAQGADWVGTDPGGDHPRRDAAGPRRGGYGLHQIAGSGAGPALGAYRRHGVASGRRACLSDGLRNGRGYGVPGAFAAPERRGAGSGPLGLPRGDGDRPGTELRRACAVRSETAEVSGPRVALHQRRGGNQDGERAQLRQPPERTATRSDEALAGIPSGRGSELCRRGPAIETRGGLSSPRPSPERPRQPEATK